MTTAREKIHLAAIATKRIDLVLAAPLYELSDATRIGNGAGVYADWQRVRRALWKARLAINTAQQIVGETNWPTNEDYDQS